MATFRIATFGCQMNVRDSQWLAAALSQRGHTEKESGADIIFLNTCSVREKPELRVREAIMRIAREHPHSLIAVLGCVAQQLGSALFQISPQVRLVGGPDAMPLLPDIAEQLLAAPSEKITLLEQAKFFPERPDVPQECPNRSAFVSIMQGCDNFCSYCIVPFTRGRQLSRARRAILSECQQWLARGALEICLLGQNVNAWGGKGPKADTEFASLLQEIAALDGLQRLRFITPHPADMGQAVVECIGQNPKICPRLHLPLQAGSDNILKAMRRRHTRSQYLRLVEDLRLARPDLALSTDLIVGFPGETESDFQETLEMISACRFISSFSFCYSDRPGTRASMLPDKISQEVKLQRLKRLQEVQDNLTADLLQERVGQFTTLLLEGPSLRGGGCCWQGRDPYGVCVNVQMPDSHDYHGHIAQVLIQDSRKHSLLGVLASGQP